MSCNPGGNDSPKLRTASFLSEGAYCDRSWMVSSAVPKAVNDGDSDVLLRALSRSFHFLPANQQQAFLQTISEEIQ
jgi:hypothetical protein